MRIKAVIVEGPMDAATIAAIRASLEADDEIVFAPLMVGDLIERVGYEMGVPRLDIVGGRRDRAACRARFAVSWLARKLTPRSMTQIGRALGDRDHSTIVHHIARASELRGRDPAFRHLTDRLVVELGEPA